jgi:formyl-CoA transferase
VFDTGDLLEHAHLRDRGAVATVEHPDMGTFVVPGNPVRLHESPTEVTRSPLLGEHNAEVYEKLLGLGADDLEGLRSSGVI